MSTVCELEAMAIENMDFPIKNMVIFHRYVSLPEGNHGLNTADDGELMVPLFLHRMLVNHENQPQWWLINDVYRCL